MDETTRQIIYFCVTILVVFVIFLVLAGKVGPRK